MSTKTKIEKRIAEKRAYIHHLLKGIPMHAADWVCVSGSNAQLAHELSRVLFELAELTLLEEIANAQK